MNLVSFRHPRREEVVRATPRTFFFDLFLNFTRVFSGSEDVHVVSALSSNYFLSFFQLVNLAFFPHLIHNKCVL